MLDNPETASGLLRGVQVDAVDVGTLLQHPNWREIAAEDGLETWFAAEDLAPVIPQPGKIICVGLNYADHIEEMGHEKPDVPTLFIKFADALTGPFDDIHVPTDAAHALDAEAELAVVIGKTAHRVSEAEAGVYIAGYAVINDYTLRDWQKRTQQWHQGKSFYRTAGFGPWLSTSVKPNATVTAEWDGEVMQQSSIDQLVFTPELLISFISQIYPLRPGDVIATGTPDGVGHARDPRRYIKDGETVRCAIEGLGEIANTTYYSPSK